MNKALLNTAQQREVLNGKKEWIMSNHFIELCCECKGVVSQCRCMGCDKKFRWSKSPCDKCQEQGVCAYISHELNSECKRKAEWRIWPELSLPTDACSEHIAELIDDEVMQCTLKRLPRKEGNGE